MIARRGFALALVCASTAWLGACGPSNKVDLGGDLPGSQAADGSVAYVAVDGASSPGADDGAVQDAGASAAPDAMAMNAAAMDASACSPADASACGANMICLVRSPTATSAGTCAVNPSSPLGNSMCAPTDLACYCRQLCPQSPQGCQQGGFFAPDGAVQGPTTIYCS
jgi:hypothetical protein